MLSTQHKPSWGTPTGYPASHCSKCKAGWVRTGKEGGKLTLCLLDREPPSPDLTDCNKFQARELAD